MDAQDSKHSTFWRTTGTLALVWLFLMMAVGYTGQMSTGEIEGRCLFWADQVERNSTFFDSSNGEWQTLAHGNPLECIEKKKHDEVTAGSGMTAIGILGAILIFVAGMMIRTVSKKTDKFVKGIIDGVPPTNEYVFGSKGVVEQGGTLVIIHESEVHDSQIANHMTSPELGYAIKRLLDIVGHSGQPYAVKLAQTVAKKVKGQKPDKEGLKQVWAGLIAAVPVIKDSVEVFSTINDFINQL